MNLYAMVGNNPPNYWDYLGLEGGWGGAFGKLGEWLKGHETGWESFGPDSGEVEDMKDSSVAGKLRKGFLDKNSEECCEDWEDYTNVRLPFKAKEFFSDLGNGTAHFVGSASGDVYIKSVDAENRKITATFQLTNTTSLKSALYHAIPDSWNIQGPFHGRVRNDPFENWTQVYTWDEEFDCK